MALAKGRTMNLKEVGPGPDYQARSLRAAGGRSAEVGVVYALASSSTAYIYNWNMLPVGQQLWLKELSSYIEFPPLQDPASHNLSQVLDQVKKMGTSEYPQVSRSNRQTANDTNYKAIEGGGKSKLSRRVIRSNDHTRHARR
jgi:hypothetical protein